MKILLLEDNILFAESLIENLNHFGHHVDWTVSVGDAQKIFDRGGFDLVISDLHLKVINDDKGSGLDLIDYVRKRDQHVGLVATTGLGLVQKESVLQHGVDLFYYKPINSKEFIRDIA